MKNVTEWAHDVAEDCVPDLEMYGPVSAEDLVYLLRDRYYDAFGEPTTEEVRELLLSVAKEFV